MSEPIIIGDLKITDREPIPLGMVVVGGKQVKVAHYVLMTKRLAGELHNLYPELKDRAPVQFLGRDPRLMLFSSLEEAAHHKAVWLKNVDCIPMAMIAAPSSARQGMRLKQFYALPKAHLKEFPEMVARRGLPLVAKPLPASRNSRASELVPVN